MVSWRIWFIAFCLTAIAAGGQANATNGTYVFVNDGFGQIENLPLDESLYTEMRAATFRPAPGFELEPMCDSAFAIIQKMPNIEQLSISCLTDPLTERTARMISNCKKLKVLFIEHATVSHEAVPVLLGIPLDALLINCVPIAEHLKFLNREKLRNLTLRHCGLQNREATAISDSPNLQYLDVQGNEYITRGFVVQLGALKSLKVLLVEAAELSIDDCHKIIASFPKLEYTTAKTSVDGEALLVSRLAGLSLLHSFNGASPLWGMERDSKDNQRNLEKRSD